jgi:hypothetical protein
MLDLAENFVATEDNFNDAVNVLDTLVRKLPQNNMAALNRAAELALRMDNPVVAEGYLSAILRREPSNLEARRWWIF